MYIHKTSRYNKCIPNFPVRKQCDVNFEAIVRPSKLVKTKGTLRNRFHVLWVDTKRNYCVYDFDNSGKIKKNKLLKNILIKKVFDYFELKLKNFHKVSDKFYRGGAISCEYDILRLKQKGVTDIVNLMETAKFKPKLEQFAIRQGINYHCLHSNPLFGVPKSEQVQTFNNIIKNATGGVYVHCLHGKDRTGVISFIYEVEHSGKSVDQAAKNLLKYGFHAKNNPNLVKFLEDKYPELSDSRYFKSL